VMMGEVRTLVAGLRGEPAPTRGFYRYVRPVRPGKAEQPQDAA
jgi:hypothetical protein